MPVNQTFSGPFVPEPYDNSAFVTRLADLINRRADVAAQGALQRGASRAQMWQSAGQAVMQTLAQLAQQRELTKQRAVASEQQAIENAFKNRQIAVQEAAERNAEARERQDQAWRQQQYEWQRDRAEKQDRNEAAQVVVSGMGPGDELSMAAFNDRIKGTPYAEGFSVRPAVPATEGYGVLLPEYSPNARPAQPEAMQYAGTFAQLDKLAGNEMEKARLRATIQNREIDDERADETLELQRQRLKLGLQQLGDGKANRQLTNALQLTNSLKAHPAYADMSDIHTGWMGVQAGLKQRNGFGDVTAINAFQRMVDPGATVREGDVALLQSAASFKDTLLSEYPIEKLQSGAKLPEAVRERMRQVAEHLYRVRAQNYNDTVGNQYRKLAEAAQVPFELIGSEFVVTPSASAMIEAIDPSGNIHHAPAGTPLPPGWRLKQ